MSAAGDRAQPRHGSPQTRRFAAAVLALVLLVPGLGAVYLLVLAVTIPVFGPVHLVSARPPLGLALLATAAVAAAVRPLHQWSHRTGRQLMGIGSPSRYASLAGLGRRLAAVSSTDDALTELAEIACAAVGARRTDVWLWTDADWFPTAGWPAADTRRPDRPRDADLHVELRHGGELVGALSVVSAAGAPLSPEQVQLLDDLAGPAALVLGSVGLTARLRARLAVTSRQRDDLDSVQARLLSTARAAQAQFERELGEGPLAELDAIAAGAGRLIGEPAALPVLRRHAEAAIEQLRDLARGVYPPVLRDSGLAPALHARYRHRSAPVTVRATGDRLPAETELTAYLAGCDAVASALDRGAQHVDVSLSSDADRLVLTVTDDGRPGAQSSAVDLQATADRVHAAGGTFTSDPGQGCPSVVEITLPVPA